MSDRTLATSKAMESEVIAFTNALSKEADFISKCKAVSFYSTENVHVSFDEPANTGSFFVPKTTYVHINEPCEFTRISALGDSTTGNLYILARR